MFCQKTKKTKRQLQYLPFNFEYEGFFYLHLGLSVWISQRMNMITTKFLFRIWYGSDLHFFRTWKLTVLA